MKLRTTELQRLASQKPSHTIISFIMTFLMVSIIICFSLQFSQIKNTVSKGFYFPSLLILEQEPVLLSPETLFFFFLIRVQPVEVQGAEQ